MTGRSPDITPPLTTCFEHALSRLPNGYVSGRFAGRPWSLTTKRSPDGKRIWLYGEERGGTEIVSFNLYRLSTDAMVLKPCEMSSAKVIDFVLRFEPLSD